jgi:hypothetical protein
MITMLKFNKSPPKDIQAPRDAALQPNSKHEISSFFPFHGKILAYLNSDPDSQSGTGSTDPSESGSDTDRDWKKT